jgi:hypothetical protein
VKIQQVLIELSLTVEGPPIFDIQLQPRAPGVPAPVLLVYPRVERSSIIAKTQQVKLVTCLVFAVDPDLPVENRRLGLLTPGGMIPDELADEAQHLGTFQHPANGAPISVYEFKYEEIAIDPAEERALRLVEDPVPNNATIEAAVVSGEIIAP